MATTNDDMAAADAAFELALTHHQAGRLDEAERTYQQVLQADPGHPGALYLLGGIAYQRGNYKLAFDLVAQCVSDEPDDPDALHLLGLAALQLKDYAQAKTLIERALAINPQYVQAHHSLGTLWQAQDNYDAADEHFRRASTINPQYAEAYCGLGHTDRLRGNYLEAVNKYNLAISCDANCVEAYSYRGIAFFALMRYEEALASFDATIKINPSAESYVYRGDVLRELKRFHEATQAYGRALEIDANLPYVAGKKFDSELQVCNWEHYATAVDEIVTQVRAGKRVAVPFSFLAMASSAADQLLCTRAYMADEHFRPAPLWNGEKYQHDKIRIGYLSGDFHNHPVAFLIAELFEIHDRNRFELNAFSYGPHTDDVMRERIQNAFDTFTDVKSYSDAQVAALIRAQEIDIVVDLKGLTGSSRTGILAYRCAPVQVNYLGYPGTLGADYIDYIIGDNVITPLERAADYAEKIVCLPDSYQANDSQRKIAERTPTRAEVNLPESGFVFCCFNNNYKITPEIFAIWMRLLQQVPGSVFWLFEDNSLAFENLRRAAQQHGIAPERLVPAQRMPLVDHLARHRLADLFLDTLHYNAHTTASDALWVGLPLLTCRQGDAFASRVAASLLTAIGMPELITENLSQYETLALELATSPDMLAALKNKLSEHREQWPLFNGQRFKAHIESAYMMMHQRQQRGLPPESFKVPPQAPSHLPGSTSQYG